MRYIIKISFAMLITGCGLAAHAESSSAPSVPVSTTVAPTTTTTTTTVAPTTTTTTTTTLPPLTFVPRCPHIVDIARQVGWADTDLPMIDRLAWRESRCDIDWGTGQPRQAHNPTDPSGGSYGALQINGSWCKKNRWNPHPAGFLGGLGILDDCHDLWNWETNLRAAKALYEYSLNRHGWDLRWRPWYPLPKD